ncbi:MAG: L,D-transpeptidase family protein, partial [Hyphomicrobiaceae bacterium]|nr:L,D-transpeptidase family protein [Hyphomicrobiaceae bacterium]
RDGQRDRAAIAEFYSAREFAPVFLDAGAINARGQAVLETLAAAAREGLDPEAYDAPETARIAAEATDAAATELRLARAALHYARDAYTGRIAPGDVASDITIERHIANPVEILATLADAPDAGATLLAYNPPHEGYRLLRDALARLRHDAEDEHHVEVPAGSTLRLGDVDSRVALLRERLGVAMPENAPPGIGAAEPAFDPERFDEALEQAVKTFQDEHGLAADGIVGPATLASLNAGAGDLIPEVIANMERWRWLPRDLGRFHVFVNVPEYRVFVVRGGETVHTTRVIVGQRQHRTPIFSDEMEHIVVNPYWHVPTSILTNEMLPRIQADPTYLSRANYEVVARVGGRSQVVDPTAIDWSTVRRGQVYVRQRPGGGNALGQIKFMFPNQHSVYLHDTSSRGLFTRDRRALSHGCVRVENPFEFADVILSEERQWTPARVRGLVGGSERTIALDSHLPVHLAYFTARVDDEGRLRMFDDIYGHNARTRQLLGL